jgi:hypothetical protein
LNICSILALCKKCLAIDLFNIQHPASF